MKKEKDTINIVSQKQIEKQLKHIGTQRLRPGHTCFKINNATNEVMPAKKESTANMNGGVKHKIVVEEGYSYVTALNAKNALRKFANS